MQQQRGGEEEGEEMSLLRQINLLKDYCFALLYSVKKIYKKNPPFCEHGNTSTLFLSQSKDNFNRPFFKCANGPGYDPCSYFQWADEEPNEFTLSQNHPRPGYICTKTSTTTITTITTITTTHQIQEEEEDGVGVSS